MSQVSFGQLGNKPDTIEHQFREPFLTDKAFQKFTTRFVSMQGKIGVFEESMKQIQMTVNGNPPPKPSWLHLKVTFLICHCVWMALRWKF